MRMMKRVAVSILAAAMALSLMTACGGGDAPSAPETPSNPGTSQGTGNGNSGNNGDNNSNKEPDKEPDKEDENKLPTSWNASKTKAYYNTKGISNTNIYVNGTVTAMDAKQGTTKGTMEVVYAAKGGKLYISMTEDDNLIKVYKNEADEYFVSDGSMWIACTNSQDIQSAKMVLMVGQVLYKVQNNPTGFKAYRENGYYYEGMYSKWSTGADVGYIYGYTSDNQLAAVACKLDDTIYMTIPQTLTANPNSGLFPNL